MQKWQRHRELSFCVNRSISQLWAKSNVASQRVLEKIGLERCGERSFPHPAYAAEGPLAWFEREADAWLAERRAQ